MQAFMNWLGSYKAGSHNAGICALQFSRFCQNLTLSDNSSMKSASVVAEV
jgi:hypothetical protein